jgi:hypothetical protein
MPAARGPTSRTTLRIDWKHPTGPAQVAADGERTVASQARRALSAEDALALIAGDDPRPLIVLRECLACSGTEDALMSSKEDNERTYLMARWFHCVKLPPDVLEDDHPFRNLFPGEKPAHLFLALEDGRMRHDLEGEHSRRELWGAMEAALAATYAESHQAALSRLVRILDDLDEVDRALADLETRFELAIASDGANASGTKKLQKQLNERRARRDELVAEASKVSALAPKPEPAPATR